MQWFLLLSLHVILIQNFILLIYVRIKLLPIRIWLHLIMLFCSSFYKDITSYTVFDSFFISIFYCIRNYLLTLLISPYVLLDVCNVFYCLFSWMFQLFYFIYFVLCILMWTEPLEEQYCNTERVKGYPV